MARARGQLGQQIMEVLWAAPAGATAREVVERLDGPTAATTTVLTVLSRLREKGLVERSEVGGAHVYRTTTSRETSLVDTMIVSLGTAPDRQAALLRFVGELDDADTETLRQALGRQERRPGRRGRAGRGDQAGTDE